MSVRHFITKPNNQKRITAVFVILIVGSIGTYLLVGSHAASPYVSTTATSGTLANGAASCPTAGASTSNAVTFNSPIATDGAVALGLSCPGTPFAASSFWNTPLPTDTPVNTNNTAYVNDIAYNLCSDSTVEAASPPNPCNSSAYGSLATNTYSAPLYVVPANQPLVSVNPSPASLCGAGSDPAGSSYFVNTVLAPGVPIPTDAHSSGQENVPDQPIIASQGEAGTTSYSYALVAVETGGNSSEVSLSGSTNAGNATLSAANYNTVTWTPVAGVAQYRVYRTSSGGTPSSTGLIGTVNANEAGVPQTFNDTGIAATTATPSGDTDKEIQIYQPSGDSDEGKYWDFWRLTKDSSGNWQACWGGVINDVSQSDGISPDDSGATATSLPLLGAVVRIEELQAGQINHVIGIALGDVVTGDLAANVIPPNTPGATSGISWPATRTDGISTNTFAVPEGLRFRLPASFNLNQYNATLIANKQSPLSPVAMAIAAAAQKYGFVVDDSSPQPGIGIRLGDQTTYTTAGLPSPYSNGPGVGGVGDSGLFDGVTQGQILNNFPWNQLEALPFNYGEPSSP